MSKVILDGIMGLAVADALGVPVEFNDRESLKQNPVTGLRSYGTFHQPAGTWSDDTSMTLCLLHSLSHGIDYREIMDYFSRWFYQGDYTPHGEAFGIGTTTREAINRYSRGIHPLECGGKGEYDNGNGSLMRILPVLFYLQDRYGKDFKNQQSAFDLIHNISSLTHGHKRSLISCGIYICVASRLLDKNPLDKSVKLGINDALDYYQNQDGFKEEIHHFSRLEDEHFKDLSSDEIRSSGYVVDTLEAAIWCLLNTKDYKSCVLMAVNLGNDADTVGAVAGGLAGLYYGVENIPDDWIKGTVRRDFIEELCERLEGTLNLKRRV